MSRIYAATRCPPISPHVLHAGGTIDQQQELMPTTPVQPATAEQHATWTPGATIRNGADMRAARQAMGLTQEAAGRAMGLTQRALSDIERGIHHPTNQQRASVTMLQWMSNSGILKGFLASIKKNNE